MIKHNHQPFEEQEMDERERVPVVWVRCFVWVDV